MSRTADRPHQDRLEHPMLAQRVSQGGNLGGREMAAGLVRIGIDLIDGNVKQFGGLQGTRLEPPFLASQERFQTTSQASFIHGR
jgi:hypothetical protein